MEPVSNDVQLSPASGQSQADAAAGTSFLPSSMAADPAPAAPQVAQDSDLIEDEWVAAVKNIMHTYHNDPSGLADALSALRRDYLSKRYGRNLKAAE